MQGNGKAQAPSRRPDAVCLWCNEPFDDGDRTLHVSKLGAPGVFHRACFEEYEQSAPA